MKKFGKKQEPKELKDKNIQQILDGAGTTYHHGKKLYSLNGNEINEIIRKSELPIKH